ncbi:MAG TPA: glutaredoxin family protein [Candidatus Thermoplasmatota archaeon]|nr:glutaredoxin family protein [Candidatus Thermoplasmatota archaeon]
MKRLRLRERQFKRVAFASTLGGIVLIAVGLQRLLVAGSWTQLALLALPGIALALVSVFLEIVPEAGFTVTLYTREGCSLCDAARAFLVGKKSEYDYDLWEVDVDKDEKAGARYSDWVPVATVRDEELFRLAPDYVRLEARLRELADARVRR